MQHFTKLSKGFQIASSSVLWALITFCSHVNFISTILELITENHMALTIVSKIILGQWKLIPRFPSQKISKMMRLGGYEGFDTDLESCWWLPTFLKTLESGITTFANILVFLHIFIFTWYLLPNMVNSNLWNHVRNLGILESWNQAKIPKDFESRQRNSIVSDPSGGYYSLFIPADLKRKAEI